jgi:hypothetical protein
VPDSIPHLNYRLSDIYIIRVEPVYYLGVILDPNLTFKEQNDTKHTQCSVLSNIGLEIHLYLGIF